MRQVLPVLPPLLPLLPFVNAAISFEGEYEYSKEAPLCCPIDLLAASCTACIPCHLLQAMLLSENRIISICFNVPHHGPNGQLRPTWPFTLQDPHILPAIKRVSSAQ